MAILSPGGAALSTGTGVNAGSPDASPAAAELQLVADGFTQPLYVTGVDDGSGRLFVVEQVGTIRVIEDGQILPEPFLDISNQIDTSKLERGMLGLAFHPDYDLNGRLFVTYVPLNGHWRLEEYSVSADPNRVDLASARELIYLPNEGHFGGHYGGMLTFGPDGYLYVTIGDGGGAFDPFSNAQNLETLAGSMLRLDVDGEAPYGIPEDNPFVEISSARGEIWHYGLRNPWRFSFDRETGDLYIGDVGHVEFEEVDYVPAHDPGGINFGWPSVEGPECSEAAPECDPSQFEPPIHSYSHRDGCTVVGGYVYRWHPASQLYGHYIFGDYCRGRIWSLQRTGDGEWMWELLIETHHNYSSFGEGADGRLYVTDVTGGGLYEIVDPNLSDLPTIDRLSQSTIVVGGAACHLDIIGANFKEGATLLWNGQERPSERIDGGRMRIEIQAGADLEEGIARISVHNPDTGQPASNEAELDIIGGLIAGDAIADRWRRYDQPILAGVIQRTWTWGPNGTSCLGLEPYASSPNGVRAVQYFDKARLEVTFPDGDPESIWYVTTGLLATEMITGRMQVGDGSFQSRSPAAINVAGDAGNSSGPTYAALGQRIDDPPQPLGTPIETSIDSSGMVSVDPAYASHGVQATFIDDVTNHAIAEPFWDFLNNTSLIWDGEAYVEAQFFENPFYVSGRPITEAYWTTVPVGGQQRDVLLQCFERRCLTYTPTNPESWRVEAGNTGLHYFNWRYD